VQVQPQHADFDGMRRAWREAEEMGCDSIFTWDHFYPLYGEPEGKHFECLTTMASLAENTERAQIGALVVCNSYRNPELLADAHRTVDHISGGRCILGIGSGWFEQDYQEYGYEFGTKPSRLRDLAAALPRIKDRLAKLNPPPIGPMPILIGGGGPKMTLKLVARFADAWHSSGDPDTFREKDAILRQHCADAGRDPDEIERTWGIRELEKWGGFDELAEAGVTLFIPGIGGDGHGYDLAPLRELIEWRDARERTRAA
jgi:probable F420-dependent oxidoreductase